MLATVLHMLRILTPPLVIVPWLQVHELAWWWVLGNPIRRLHELELGLLHNVLPWLLYQSTGTVRWVLALMVLELGVDHIEWRIRSDLILQLRSIQRTIRCPPLHWYLLNVIRLQLPA